MHCRKNYTLCAILLTGALLVVAALPAFGQTCMQDVYSLSNTQTLNCTANDVQLAAVKGVRVINVDPATGVKTLSTTNQCLAGTTFDFLADFEVVTTSSKTRSNIGLYFGTGATSSSPPPNQNGALTGTCTDSIISPPHLCAGTWSGITPTCGSDHYNEFDPSPDSCGDTSSADTSSAYPGVAGAQGVTVEVDNVTCPTSGTTVMLPECTSWQVPGKQLQCVSPAPNYPFENTAIAGSPSKCSCGTLSIPVQPVNPGASVVKSCSTSLTPNSTNDPTVVCNAGAEGSTVTYTVAITNQSDSGGVVIDQICDNRYGSVYDDGAVEAGGGSACTAGTLGTIVSGSASSCASLGAINTSASCTFQAVQSENGDVTDTVTVRGHSSLVASNKFGPANSNQVEVTSSDAPSTATTNKALVGPNQACLTLRYNVTVQNSSGADETLRLQPSGTPGSGSYVPALNDSYFSDVTALHGAGGDGSVKGTTCGIDTASQGAGTLSGSKGAGVFPATIAPGASYTCQFDGVACGPVGPITGVCAEGFQNTDTVTANLTGDEGETVTQTENPLTATVCMSQP